MQLTAEQRIERAHVRLMQSKQFCLFSGVFMVGKVEVTDKCRTASTNGRDVTYGRGFVDSLTDKQLAFLIVHEAMHKAYRHLTVWSKLADIDRRIANMAMDYVINLQIVDSDPCEEEVSMPRDKDGKLLGLLDERFKGMDTMQVFNILRQEQEQEQDEGEGGDGGDDSEGQDDGQSSSPSSNGNGMDDHDWDGAEDMTQEEEEELQREIDSALREGAMLAGRMKGDVKREIMELLHPKVDWRETLRDFVKLATRGGDQSTWRRPNRRYLGVDIVMPTTETHKAEMFVVGVDTSASIGANELSQFLSEVKCICDEVAPETIELLYWDTAIAKHETYHGPEINDLVESTKPHGGGGTVAGCVPVYMHEKQLSPQCVIMLTDGYLWNEKSEVWDTNNAPVLWCVQGNRTFVPPVGQSVFVE